jgi:hypothetical protein
MQIIVEGTGKTGAAIAEKYLELVREGFDLPAIEAAKILGVTVGDIRNHFREPAPFVRINRCAEAHILRHPDTTSDEKNLIRRSQMLYHRTKFKEAVAAASKRIRDYALIPYGDLPAEIRTKFETLREGSVFAPSIDVQTIVNKFNKTIRAENAKPLESPVGNPGPLPGKLYSAREIAAIHKASTCRAGIQLAHRYGADRIVFHGSTRYDIGQFRVEPERAGLIKIRRTGEQPARLVTKLILEHLEKAG